MHERKTNPDPFLLYDTQKIMSKCIIDLNANAKSLKLLKKNITEYP